ncbi:MAG: hypothetical protein DRO09_00135 [Thermoprotei archaeon]|nr:MAG: hypothetical protein DRO09_00135 [Thermoprotei archaeon]
MVYDLAVALKARGHEVSVACCKGSKLPEGVEAIETVEPKMTPYGDWWSWEKEHYELYKHRLKDFDVVHDHTWMAWPYIYKAKENPELKLIHTHHGHVAWSSPPPVPKPCLVGLSKWHANVMSSRLGVTVRHAYNGVDVDSFPFKAEKARKLVYIGRMAKYKQPHVAIDVAKKLKVPIDVAGGERFVEDPGYVLRVMGMCDGLMYKYHGEVSDRKKKELLAEAACLIFPSWMGEPFGLVAVEAMACGTPVAALRDGAIPEVVVDGETGFLADDFDGLVEAVKRILDGEIKPDKCRERALLFSRERMAERYEQLYYDVLRGEEW